MDDGSNNTPPKRTDVGYGRPPKESQFKKGQKRPPRKPKEGGGQVPLTEILRKVLHEPRRVVINGKVKYVTGAELVIRRAYQEAEKGNATLRRELARLLLGIEVRAGDDAPQVVTDPAAPEDATGLRMMPLDEER
jgi:hypothetical protein